MEILTVVAAGVVGAAIGSFLNVVVHRVPRRLSLVNPRSACPACEHEIGALDNVPVLSYVVLRGRCRHCRTRISPRYPVVELLTAASFAGAFIRFDRVEVAVFASAACAVLVALAFIDLEHKRVPNVIVVPATAVAVVWVAAVAVASADAAVFVEPFAAGASAFAVMFVIAVASGGIGFGDVKLAAFIGVVTGRFGWEATVLAVFTGFVAGGIVAIVLLVARRADRKTAIPFAPMLCFGAVLAVFAGSAPVRGWFGY